ncbi:uncharacterized protein EV422DRAFT_567358 [Fimicolochytrium jonesii]|uniref:uncharacterized protein n=1 Tax=Fimicolochytrium jonesii TaxID=1396493 RepID=UPI0022FDC2DB|nr:uncharacterized protein EV422DRAFT_567358 [Fimicolochytrium jonesii]KAI8821035.1 hypothetical protein EV422DRAFT_567358 [Fimicolochytrium jonesii]
MFRFVLFKDGTDQEILRKTLLVTRIMLMALWMLVFAWFLRISKATTSGCGKGLYSEPAIKARGDGISLQEFDQHLGEVAKAYDQMRIEDPWFVPNVFSSSARWAPPVQDTPGFLLSCDYEERQAFISVNVSLPDVRPQAFVGSMKDFARRSLGEDLVADVPDDQLGMETA